MNSIEIKNLLKFSFKVNDSVLITGDHGIGKSSVVKQFAKENNFYTEDLILSIKEPADLLGMPDSEESENGKRTVWNEPDWFQRITNAAWPLYFKYDDLIFEDEQFKTFCSELNSDKVIKREHLNELFKKYFDLYENKLYLVTNQSVVKCKKSRHSILFLDELNRAQPDTRQTALQLVLEKELHSHKLPFLDGKQTFIIAAINPSDKYQTAELDLALLDRFTVIEMIVDVKSFLKYARENGILQVIIDFISEFNDRLHIIYNDLSRGPTPRSWEKVSDYLKQNLDRSSLWNVLKGRLGEEVAYQFLSYFESKDNKVSLDVLEKSIQEKFKKLSFDELVSETKTMTKDLESIRKTELLNQSLYNNTEELILGNYNSKCLTLLVMIYSFETEITYSVLQTIKKDEQTKKLYYAVAKLDEAINNKKFFNEIAISVLKL